MTAATVPEALKRCHICELRSVPSGRPRYWQAWPATQRPHLIYSMIGKQHPNGIAALTACRLKWPGPLAALDRFDYLFPRSKRAPIAAAKPAKPLSYGPIWRD